MLKNDVIWPDHRQFDSKTEWEPIGFFSECLCNATSFDLMLGFFSSSAGAFVVYGLMISIFNALYSSFELNRNRKNFREQMKSTLSNTAEDVQKEVA